MNDTDATVVLREAPPRRRWGRFVVLTLVLIILGSVLSWTGMQVFRRYQAQQTLDEAVAAVDQKDSGWRLEDLEASRTAIADDQNPALVIVKARSLLPKSWLPALPGPLPQHQILPDQLEEIETQLQAVGEALSVSASLSQPRDGQFPNEDPRSPLDESKNSSNAPTVAQLLRMRATALAQRGDLEGAAQATLGVACTARAIGDERRLVAQMMRLRCRNELLFCVERLLGQGQLSVATLARIQTALEEESAVPASEYALEGERAGYHQMALSAEAGSIDLAKISLQVSTPPNPYKEFVFGTLTSTLARQGHARMLPVMTELVAVTRLPPEAQREAQDKLAGDWNFRIGDYWYFFPDLHKRVRGVPGLFRINLAWMRCGIVAVAAERYRQAHGRWPEKVEDLADGPLPSWAKDPLGGSAPLLLERKKDGLTIRSQGKDGTGADNGAPDRRASVSVPPMTRLYDVDKRRQPPQPRPTEERD